jgi:hypothetical protein
VPRRLIAARISHQRETSATGTVTTFVRKLRNRAVVVLAPVVWWKVMPVIAISSGHAPCEFKR